MESALYGIYALVVFVLKNSCVNTVRALFPWSNHYIIYVVAHYLTERDFPCHAL